MTNAQRLQLFQWAQWIVSALFLGGSAVLFARRAREPVVALLALGLPIGLAQTAAVLLADARLIDLAFAIDLQALLLGLALIVFPSGRFEPRWSALVAIGLVALVALDPWLSDSASLAFLIVVASAILAVNLVRYRRLATPVERQQVKWATLGFALSILLILAMNVVFFVMPLIANPAIAVMLSASTNVLQVLSVATLIGGLLVSLLRYRLYDADAALSRSAVYGGLALTMIALFAGTEKLFELLAEEYWGESFGAASGAIAAGIAAASIPPLHHRLNRWAERRFQGQLLALRNRLPDDLADWRETASTRQLAQDALLQIMSALRSRAGAIVTKGPSPAVLAICDLDDGALAGWLGQRDPAAAELDRDDPLLPLRITLGPLPGRSCAYLLLGSRPDGTTPGKDERDAADAVADPLARALGVTMRRQERDEELRGALENLAARLSQLEARRAPSKTRRRKLP